MSSSDYAIRIKGIGKQYRLGLEQSGNVHHRTLRDSITGFARRPIGTIKNSLFADPLDECNSFWALKDVSFDVKKGEVVGIIGRNGAGKSTLLKILSRITRPTTGEIELHGRVGSLLEVGTGFHAELSGRENIFLNGAILGMTQQEIRKQFDAIIAFSGVERFIDSPVKHYSSGMYVRLAFAVAAHLRSDILIVDEVLAVGDAQFQSKCLDKMKDMSRSGRTALYVSHNLDSVVSLCGKAMVLNAGMQQFYGPTDSAIRLLRLEHRSALSSAELENDPTCVARIRRARLITQDSETNVPRDKPIQVEVRYTVNAPTEGLALGIMLDDAFGRRIGSCATVDENPDLNDARVQPGDYTALATLPAGLLNPGHYHLSIGLAKGVPSLIEYHRLQDAVCFTISQTNSPSWRHYAPRNGPIALRAIWTDIR